jgi:hypothetical protein
MPKERMFISPMVPQRGFTLCLTRAEIIVIDSQTEEPIPAAQIKIAQKEVEAYTDFDGLAEIKNLSVGSYDIEISFISYEKLNLKGFYLDQQSRQLVVKLKS